MPQLGIGIEQDEPVTRDKIQIQCEKEHGRIAVQGIQANPRSLSHYAPSFSPEFVHQFAGDPGLFVAPLGILVGCLVGIHQLPKSSVGRMRCRHLSPTTNDVRGPWFRNSFALSKVGRGFAGSIDPGTTGFVVAAFAVAGRMDARVRIQWWLEGFRVDLLFVLCRSTAAAARHRLCSGWMRSRLR